MDERWGTQLDHTWDMKTAAMWAAPWAEAAGWAVALATSKGD